MGRFSVPARGESRVELSSPKTGLDIISLWPKATMERAVAREITGVLQVIVRIVQRIRKVLLFILSRGNSSPRRYTGSTSRVAGLRVAEPGVEPGIFSFKGRRPTIRRLGNAGYILALKLGRKREEEPVFGLRLNPRGGVCPNPKGLWPEGRRRFREHRRGNYFRGRHWRRFG